MTVRRPLDECLAGEAGCLAARLQQQEQDSETEQHECCRCRQLRVGARVSERNDSGGLLGVLERDDTVVGDRRDHRLLIHRGGVGRRRHHDLRGVVDRNRQRGGGVVGGLVPGRDLDLVLVAVGVLRGVDRERERVGVVEPRPELLGPLAVDLLHELDIGLGGVRLDLADLVHVHTTRDHGGRGDDRGLGRVDGHELGRRDAAEPVLQGDPVVSLDDAEDARGETVEVTPLVGRQQLDERAVGVGDRGLDDVRLVVQAERHGAEHHVILGADEPVLDREGRTGDVEPRDVRLCARGVGVCIGQVARAVLHLDRVLALDATEGAGGDVVVIRVRVVGLVEPDAVDEDAVDALVVEQLPVVLLGEAVDRLVGQLVVPGRGGQVDGELGGDGRRGVTRVVLGCHLDLVLRRLVLTQQVRVEGVAVGVVERDTLQLHPLAVDQLVELDVGRGRVVLDLGDVEGVVVVDVLADDRDRDDRLGRVDGVGHEGDLVRHDVTGLGGRDLLLGRKEVRLSGRHHDGRLAGLGLLDDLGRRLAVGDLLGGRSRRLDLLGGCRECE